MKKGDLALMAGGRQFPMAETGQQREYDAIGLEDCGGTLLFNNSAVTNSGIRVPSA